MTNGLITAAVIGLFINIITATINRKFALKLVPWLILYLLIIGLYEILTIPMMQEVAMEIAKKYPKWMAYLFVIVITGSLGGLYWKFINDGLTKIEGKIEAKGKEQSPPDPKKSDSDQIKPPKPEVPKDLPAQPTPPSLMAPKEPAKEPPDITKAKQTTITSLNQLFSASPLKDVSGIVAGYFELTGGPAPNSNFSNPMVTTKDSFSTHLYASVRLAALENAQTLDFMGRDIWVCVLPDWTAFMIWETEQLQTTWMPIHGIEKNPILNTLAIYQDGKAVSIFVNNRYMGGYTKVRPPQPGPISIALKANRIKGGKMFFRDFSVWDFGS